MFDVVIVGGGPAGLSAGLVLGRQKRKVLLVDGGLPRNRFAAEMHMVLGRDGTPPANLLADGRTELDKYGVERITDTVTQASGSTGDFTLTLASSKTVQARTVLLAIGVSDRPWDIPGLKERWGVCVFHCPFCHGHENDGRTIAVIGNGYEAAIGAYLADRYSKDVVVCTHGPAELPEEVSSKLEARNVKVVETSLTQIDGQLDDLKLTFSDGSTLTRQAIFHAPPTEPSTDLAAQLGCTLYEDGGIQIDEFQRTTVPGVFAAGDIARQPAIAKSVTLVAAGAGAGVEAAVWLEQDLFIGRFSSASES
ncbi:MAG: NAD(P)/FAD-dependent oxidoreductase [Myxococcota bacterium]